MQGDSASGRSTRGYLIAAAAFSGVSLLLFGVASHDRVFVKAQGPHDGASDRDECEEYAAREFVAGRDPWLATDSRFMPLTTGYSSVLFLSAFAALFGRIDEAAFLIVLPAFLAIAFTPQGGDVDGVTMRAAQPGPEP